MTEAERIECAVFRRAQFDLVQLIAAAVEALGFDGFDWCHLFLSFRLCLNPLIQSLLTRQVTKERPINVDIVNGEIQFVND